LKETAKLRDIENERFKKPQRTSQGSKKIYRIRNPKEKINKCREKNIN